MSDLLKTIAGPVVALLGSIAVALLGYRQWKKQQDVVRFGGVLLDRQATYKALWEKVEAVHLFVRSETFDRDRYLALVRDVNTHMIHVGLLLDHGEKQRVNQYMSALGALGETLSASAASESKAQAREMMYDTGPLSPVVLNAVKGLGPAYSAVESAREDLIAHFRTVLGAHLFT